MPRRRRSVAVPSLAGVAALAAGAVALAPATAAPAPTAAAAPATTTQTNPGWALDRIDQRARPLDGRYRSRATGAGVTAYVIDCGFEPTNPQFGGRASRGLNAIGGPWRGCSDEMGVSHATFVAGIIGGRTTGVAKGVRLVSVRALAGGEGGGAPSEAAQRSAVVRGLDWVIARKKASGGPAVVNMSLNFDTRSRGLNAAMARLEKAGILAVVAAGNDEGSACLHPPADVPTAVVVAASTSSDRRWSGSNVGRCVDLFAPGLSVRSVSWDGGTFWYEGSGATSWATPYVTGAAALYLSRHPKATPAQVRSWLLGSATVGWLQGLPTGTPNRLLHTFAPM